MTLSHIIYHIPSPQQCAHWYSQWIPSSPIPVKKTPLGQLVILAVKKNSHQDPILSSKVFTSNKPWIIPELPQDTVVSTDPSFLISFSVSFLDFAAGCHQSVTAFSLKWGRKKCPVPWPWSLSRSYECPQWSSYHLLCVMPHNLFSGWNSNCICTHQCLAGWFQHK